MKSFEFKITNKNGLHARPAGAITTFAKGFNGEITISLGEREAIGNRLLSVMSLGAKCGDTICFKINGENEEEAVNSLKEICESKLSEVK